MGPNKDELLRNAKKMAEEEAKRRASIATEKPIGRMQSRMPIGCWMWILAAAALIIWLIKTYGPGI